MKLKESVFVSVILGYVLAVFFVVVIEYEIKNQNYEPQPIPMVELFGNGSSRSYEVENPFVPDLFSSIGFALSRFSFALPFVVAGLGLWNVPLAMIYGSFTIPQEVPYQMLAFLATSIASIPIITILSKEIPMWRRIPYIYLIAALVAGTPILFSHFGQ